MKIPNHTLLFLISPIIMMGVALTFCIQMIPDSNLSMEFAIRIETPIYFSQSLQANTIKILKLGDNCFLP